MAAEDVSEHHEHEPDLNHQQKQPTYRVDELAHTEHIGNHEALPRSAELFSFSGTAVNVDTTRSSSLTCT